MQITGIAARNLLSVPSDVNTGTRDSYNTRGFLLYHTAVIYFTTTQKISRDFNQTLNPLLSLYNKIVCTPI